MIPQQIIDQILQTAKIEDVISDFVSLKQKGVNYMGCCPFHNENTPSFVVSPAKGIFKCFGCGKGGNALTFVLEHEQLSYPEAIKYVAKKYNIEVPEEELSPEEQKNKNRRSTLFSINQMAQKYYTKECNEGTIGYAYLKDRGFTEDDINAFGLGYAKDGFNNFLSYAATKGYSPQLLLEAGIISEKNGKFFDKFQERIIFPIQNLTGNIAGFTGRVTEKDSKYAKYFNTSETEIFQKSNLLYGLFQAKSAIVREGRANIVEGNTDVISLHKKGLSNTVATCGTSLTSLHARMLKRFTNDVTIIFDGDNAGQKATTRGIEILAAEGLNCYIAILPEGEDPDSFANKNNTSFLKTWLEKTEQDFILYLANIHKKTIEDKPAEQSKLIKQILAIIEKMPEASKREAYIKQVSEVFETSVGALKKDIAIKTESKQGIWGLDVNKKAIEEEDEVYFYDNRVDAIAFLASSNNNKKNPDELTSNVIAAEKLTSKDITAIGSLTKNIVINKLPQIFIENKKEVPFISILKNLVIYGFNVMCSPPPIMEIETDYISFVDVYVAVLHTFHDPNDNADVNLTLDFIAQFLAQIDSTTTTRKTKEIGKLFNLDKGDFKSILKPYLNKEQNRKRQADENFEIDGIQYVFESDKLPKYVDSSYLRKYRHFPAENKNGHKIFYVFEDAHRNYQKISNFYMQPLFHVYDPNMDKNKRVVKLKHENGYEKYLEVPSNAMVNLPTFRQFLWAQGNYQYIGAKNYHHEMILNAIGEHFPVVYELNVFGQQHEDFYAFTNAIVTKEGEVKYMDELGLVEGPDNKKYYSPSISAIYEHLRKDNDQFAQDRFFKYLQTTNTSFEKWTSLMLEVFKYNKNGHWAILFAIMCAFRSDIFKIDRLFTSIFLIGPTECGKSQVAQSIRALFFDPDAPMFNLNSGTDAAFFSMLERYRDAPVVMEEYNDLQISDTKFQGLKAAVYDGEGKTKRKDASSKDLDVSQVNSPIILLGQEAPERDDGSLYNRCINCYVVKKDDWTDREKECFQDLKTREKKGLQNILLSVLRQRPIIRKHFAKKLRIVQKEVQKDLQRNNIPFQTRILNTVSLFLAIVKIWEDYVPEFSLNFSYDEFYIIAKEKIVKQSETIMSSNRLAKFFDALIVLANRDGSAGIQNGKEFKIEILDELQTRESRTEFRDHTWPKGKRVLFIRLNDIYPLYKQLEGKEHLKINNLQNYLKDHHAFIGAVKSTTFKWEHVAEEISGSGVKKVMKETIQKTSAFALDYDLLSIDMGVSTNKKEWSEAAPPDSEGNKNDTSSEKGDDLPF